MADKMTKNSIRILITGGGTGGHLFPGIAVAEAVMERLPASEVLFVTPGRPVDRKGLAGKGFRVEELKSHALKGESATGRMKGLLQLPASLADAFAILRRFKPDIVLGVGGYVTGPMLLAARMLMMQTCIHEQNSVPGLTNRLLGRIVHRVFVSIPGSGSYFPASKVVLTGNPVRRDFTAQAGKQPENQESLTVFVTGGSQGAHAVNMLFMKAVSDLLARFGSRLKVIHQTGSQDEKEVAAHYKSIGLSARVQSFFDDMAANYAAADIVVARAGATSVAELAVMGKAAFLIPYPYAADNHQEKNGRYLVNAAAAQMVLQEELDEKMLAAQLGDLLANPDKMKAMGAAAARLARPDAAGEIVSQCLSMINGTRLTRPENGLCRVIL